MKDITFTVESLEHITDAVFKLTLSANEPLPLCRAGQFIQLKVNDASVMLRRPFCLYQFSARSVSLVIAVVGKGTEILSRMKKGETVRGIIPVGNGFNLGASDRKIALIGGGIGCAPLLAVPVGNPDREVRSYLGFGTKDPVLSLFENDFKKVSSVTVSTDDGTSGFHGYITDAFMRDFQNGYRPDVILTCGPEPMIKAVAKISLQNKIPAYMTGETRMGCGVGACLVCACAVRGEDGAVHNKRACVDGPVFSLEELVL